MIDKLEVKLFIKRKENKQDKRAFSLYLTEKAKKELPIIENYENQVLDTIVKELNINDAETIKNTLKKIRSNISEI